MLWVHVAPDFNAIVSKRRNPAQNFGNFKEGMKFDPHPPIFAQVFILRLLVRCASHVLALSERSASPCSFVAPTIAVPVGCGAQLAAGCSCFSLGYLSVVTCLNSKRGDYLPRQISSMFYFTLRVKIRFRGDPRLPPSQLQIPRPRIRAS